MTAVTEANWLNPDINLLAKWVAAEGSPRWTDRTLRLFVSAYFLYRESGRLGEQAESLTARATANERWADTGELPHPYRVDHSPLATLFNPSAREGAARIMRMLSRPAVISHERYSPSRRAAFQSIHDILGNPFRPVACDPAWRTEAVVALAAGIYAERAFERMPVLADALDDAGCANADVLAHCRGGGPHARGCWVVDLLLGKV